jgi:prephenate dehydrogenase
MGARPLFVDAAEHDGLITGVEHLPAILAFALLDATTGGVPWREMRRLAGQRFQMATHLPPDDAAAIRDVCLGDASNLARWIDTYVAALLDWKALITSGDAERIEGAISKAVAAREKWLHDKAEGRWDFEDSPQTPQSTLSWRSLLFGQFGMRDRKR